MEIYNNSNIFAKIIRGDLPSNKIYEDDMVLAIYDIQPAAAVHALVMPKAEYISFDDFVSNASAIDIAHFFRVIQQVAEKLDMIESGYRVVMNHGKDAMQAVQHFHAHVLGKSKLGKMVISDQFHK